MTRPVPARAGLPCARLQRFGSSANAAAYAAHVDRRKIPAACPHCNGWHVRTATEDEKRRNQARAEAERIARVKAHLESVPERSREP